MRDDGLPFDAFISYRRSDGKRAARRLRKKLQAYNISKRLKHRRSYKLKVFLDTVYERGAHDFYERNIKPALLGARNLIVLATPDAVLRPDSDDWVQREISDFRAHRGEEHILVVRAAGDFLSELPGDLSQTSPNIQIIDMRNDGFLSSLSPLRASRLADEWIKLVAPLYQVNADDLPKMRREQERAQQARIAGFTGGVIGAAGFAVAVSAYAINANLRAERTLQQSVFAASQMVQGASELKDSGEDIGPEKQLLMTSCDLFDTLADKESRKAHATALVVCEIDRLKARYAAGEYKPVMGRAAQMISDTGQAFGNKPDQDNALAYAQAIALEFALAQADSENRNIDTTQRMLANIDQMGELLEAADFLPDLIYFYEEQVWAVLELLENSAAYAKADEVMQHALIHAERASEKFHEQHIQEIALNGIAEEQTTTEDRAGHDAHLLAASLARRLAWMAHEHMGDNELAETRAKKAIALSELYQDRAEPGSGPELDFTWERIVSETQLGLALEKQGKLLDAANVYAISIAAIKNELRPIGLSEEFQKETEQLEAFLYKRLSQISATVDAPGGLE